MIEAQRHGRPACIRNRLRCDGLRARTRITRTGPESPRQSSSHRCPVCRWNGCCTRAGESQFCGSSSPGVHARSSRAGRLGSPSIQKKDPPNGLIICCAWSATPVKHYCRDRSSKRWTHLSRLPETAKAHASGITIFPFCECQLFADSCVYWAFLHRSLHHAILRTRRRLWLSDGGKKPSVYSQRIRKASS